MGGAGLGRNLAVSPTKSSEERLSYGTRTTSNAVLTHAFVPSRVSAEVARALIALALGLGAGTAVAGGLRLRASRPSS